MTITLTSVVVVAVVGLAVLVAVVHVLTVGARVAEPLAALLALEGLLPGVQALVFGQVVFVLERLRTHVTVERPCAWK